MSNPTNTDDIIDSRDIIERIEDLQAIDEDITELDQGEKDELVALLGLAQEGADYAPDWEYGEALIRDSYFKEYAQELAEEFTPASNTRDAQDMIHTQWPYTCIDWDQAARDLKMDYSAIDFDGVTYWVRS